MVLIDLVEGWPPHNKYLTAEDPSIPTYAPTLKLFAIVDLGKCPNIGPLRSAKGVVKHVSSRRRIIRPRDRGG